MCWHNYIIHTTKATFRIYSFLGFINLGYCTRFPRYWVQALLFEKRPTCIYLVLSRRQAYGIGWYTVDRATNHGGIVANQGHFL